MKKKVPYPFVTRKVFGLHMIQRGGPKQTGKNDAQWITPRGTWTRNVFNAAGWPSQGLARKALRLIKSAR